MSISKRLKNKKTWFWICTVLFVLPIMLLPVWFLACELGFGFMVYFGMPGIMLLLLGISFRFGSLLADLGDSIDRFKALTALHLVPSLKLQQLSFAGQ